MVRQLRQGRGKTGLVLANGGVVTYQAVVCLSSSPRRDGLPYPTTNPLKETTSDVQVPPVDAKADGEAIVEVRMPAHPRRTIADHVNLQTYTVEYNRDGSPLRGHIVGRLRASGHRFIANHADDSTLKQLCSQEVEPIGRSGKVKTANDGRNLFAFVGEVARL